MATGLFFSHREQAGGLGRQDPPRPALAAGPPAGRHRPAGPMPAGRPGRPLTGGRILPVALDVTRRPIAAGPRPR